MSNLADGFYAVLDTIASGVEPDPEMWVDEWAEAHMMVPKGAEPGRYRVSRTPYAREVMRVLSPNHPCKRVVVKAASQMLKTQCGLNWIGASIHQAPANILLLLPTLPLARRVSSRVSDIVKSVPVLAERVAEPRSRDARNTMDTKEFRGGALHITTAGSASNLAELPVRYLYGDEIDRWEGNVGGEGDPVRLAEMRTSTYELNKKLYYTSSPTIKGASRIDALFDQGDQRRYFVPCQRCAHFFALEWDQVEADAEMKRAWLVCPKCATGLEEREKTAMLADGEWRATATGDGETVSFELSALYMPIGWTSWLTLCKEYADAKKLLERGDHGAMQVFWNTRLALSYDNSEASTPASVLRDRREPYALRLAPRGVLVLTAAVDTQPSRLEVEIAGWGVGMENWTVDHQVLWGSAAEDEVWQKLDALLKTPIQHAGGRYLSIEVTFIDSGGANTQDVYEFVRHRRHRKIFAIKGASKPNRPIVSGKPTKVDVNWRGRSERQGADLWFIGTDVAKDWLYARYKLKSGPGAMHFSDDLHADLFEQLVAEKKTLKYRKGYPYTEWTKDNAARNEWLDMKVYNLGAAHYLGLPKKREADWERMRQKVEPLVGDLFGQVLLDAPDAPRETEVAPLVVKHSVPTVLKQRARVVVADDPHLN